jgi:hypothetical protein
VTRPSPVAVGAALLLALGAAISGCSNAAKKSAGTTSSTTTIPSSDLAIGTQPFDTANPPALPEAPIAPGVFLAASATIVLGAGTVLTMKHQRKAAGQ